MIKNDNTVAYFIIITKTSLFTTSFYFKVYSLSLLTRLKTHFMPFLEDIKIQVLESKYYIPFEPLKCSSGVDPK